VNHLSTPHPPPTAIHGIWRHPSPGVRRLLDGVAPLLLAGVVLAGPLSRYLGWKLNPTGADLEPGALELIAFAGIMALLIASLVGGVLLLGFAVARETRPRAVVRSVAWGLLPILVLFPVLVILQVPAPPHSGGPATGLVVGFLSPLLWSLTLLGALALVFVSNPGWKRPRATLLLVAWFLAHAMAITAVWFWCLVFATRTA
jgi:hypothetical protein